MSLLLKILFLFKVLLELYSRWEEYICIILLPIVITLTFNY